MKLGERGKRKEVCRVDNVIKYTYRSSFNLFTLGAIIIIPGKSIERRPFCAIDSLSKHQTPFCPVWGL